MCDTKLTEFQQATVPGVADQRQVKSSPKVKTHRRIKQGEIQWVANGTRCARVACRARSSIGEVDIKQVSVKDLPKCFRVIRRRCVCSTYRRQGEETCCQRASKHAGAAPSLSDLHG
ncbi:hypothetical protein GCM10027417_15580 [Glutamicibacter endophyticus]